MLTGYVSGAGTVAATDTILAAVQKLDGNTALKLPLVGGALTGALTGTVFTTSASTADGGRVTRFSDLGTAAFASASALTPSKTAVIVPITGKVVSLDPGTAGDYHS